MNRERPATVLVAAIMNFVFGCMCSFWGLYNAGSVVAMRALTRNTPAPGGANALDPMAMYDYVPGLYAVTVGQGCLALLLNLVLIVAGVGLLQMKRWARWTCIAYALLAILLALAHLAYTLLVASPGLERWQQEAFSGTAMPAMPPWFSTYMRVMVIAGGLMTFVVSVAYPAALLIIMLLPHVAAAFQAAGPRVPEAVDPAPLEHRPPASAGDEHIMPRQL